jgi:hypothetical protein
LATRSEVATFSEAVVAGDVRWDEILRKRADRNEKAFDVIECTVGPYHLREGFRSSQKKRDERDRNEKIERTRERLETLDLQCMRGPKTDGAIRKRVSEILTQHHAEEWITFEVKWNAVKKFKAITRGKPTADAPFRRIIQRVPRLNISTNAANIARSAAMDGIFPECRDDLGDEFEEHQRLCAGVLLQPDRGHLERGLEQRMPLLDPGLVLVDLVYVDGFFLGVCCQYRARLAEKMVEKKIELLC